MMIPAELRVIANRAAKRAGTNRATEIRLITGRPRVPKGSDVTRQVLPRVLHLDHYHAESRTGIRAGMAALKLYWSTYRYVPTVCIVAVADRDSVYSDDIH